jgi:hypothetical protein
VAATLDDTWAKVEWAHGHLDRLQSSLKRFHDDEPYLVTEEINAEGTHRVLTAYSKPIPPEIPFVFGDLIHALHSALDYLVCSLVESVGETPSPSHQWPIFSDEAMYEARAPKMLEGVPDQAINLIESLQPYNEPWGFLLRRLYELSIEEKHRALLLATSFPLPEYVGHNRPAEQGSGIRFRLSATYDKAYIDLPLDPHEPGEDFDPHFTTNVTLVKEGPTGMPVESLAAMLYNEIAHHVLTKVRRLNLLPLSMPRELPFVNP